MYTTKRLNFVAIALLLAQSQLQIVNAQQDPRPPRDRDGRNRDGGGDGGADGGNQQINFNSPEYQLLTAAEKLDHLWDAVIADQATALQSWELDNLFTQSMNTSFGRQSDVLPNGRPKINHSQGVVGRVSWEDLGGHAYTGLYDGGSEFGLMRLSEGNFILPEAPGLTPSFGLKFLRSGMRSVNALANVSFEPTNSWNFFANHFHTRVELFQDECAQDTIQRKFLEATSTIQSTGLSEISRFNADGAPVVNFEFPFDIHYVPNPDLAALWPDERQQGVRFTQQLRQIPEGSILFSVMAVNVPDDINRIGIPQEMKHIANIRLTSELVTSAFGDLSLFFQHENMRQDFERHPEWRRYVERLNRADAWNDTPVAEWPQDEQIARSWVRGQLDEYGCPFAWLLDQVITPLS